MSLARWNHELVYSLVNRFGTPLWVFDVDIARTLSAAASRNTSPRVRVELPYKAIGCPSAVKEIMEEVDGVMVNSVEQANQLVAAGVEPARMTMWVSSPENELLRAALRLGIGRVVVDDAATVETVLRTESGTSRIRGCLVRVRSEGGMAGIYGRFGVGLPDAVYLLRRLAASLGGDIGLAYHADVMQGDPDKWQEPRLRLLDAMLRLQPGGRRFWLDLGGGLPPASLQATDVTDYISPFVGHDDIYLSICPGRALIADAGIVISRITSIRRVDGSIYILVDVGANLLIPLGSASFRARACRDGRTSACIVADSVSSYGVFDSRAQLPVDSLRSGDLIFFERAGAYTWSMRSSAVQSTGTGIVIDSTGAVLSSET